MSGRMKTEVSINEWGVVDFEKQVVKTLERTGTDFARKPWLKECGCENCELMLPKNVADSGGIDGLLSTSSSSLVLSSP